MKKILLSIAFLLLSIDAVAQTITADRYRLTTGPCVLRSGSGSPNGVVTGNICDMYIDTSGGVWYTKWTGTNTSTGWAVGHNSNMEVTGNSVFDGFIGTGIYTSQTTGWRVDSTGAADFRYLFTDELHAKSFIADLEQALAGGQIIPKGVAVLSSNFTCPANSATSTLTVEDLPGASGMQVFETNDYVVVRSFSRSSGSLTIGDCVGVVTSPSTPGGTQTWTFTRAGLGSGGSMPSSTVVAAKNLVLDYGVSGNGYYEVNAIDGAYALNSPYSQVVTWTTSPVAANRTVRTRTGNLRGITGSTEYGAILGTYASGSSGQYIRASDLAFETHNINLSMYSGSTEVIKLDRTAPSFSVGSTAPSSYSSGTGVWMGNDSGTYKFRVGNPSGNRLTWDGSSLTVVGDGGGVTNINGANIQTGTVSANKLTVGTGRNMVRNSDCAASTSDWTIGTDSGLTLTIGFAAASFRLNDQNNTCYISLSGTPTVGKISYAYTSAGNEYPVVAGNKYEASVYLGVNRTGNTYISIQWFDSSSSFLSQSDGSVCTTASSGGLTLTSFCRSALIASAPVNATTARIVVFTTHTASLNPIVFFVHAYFGEALANQTEFTPWGPAGLTEIIGGMIKTSTITADKISVSSLSALSANIGTITAGSMTGVTATFGSGAVTLDSSGVTISAGNGSSNQVKWSDGSSISSNSGGSLLIKSASSGSAGLWYNSGFQNVTVDANGIILDGGTGTTGIRTSLIPATSRYVCVNTSGVLYTGTSCP